MDLYLLQITQTSSCECSIYTEQIVLIAQVLLL